METLSPFTRRLLALAILFVGLVSLINLGALPLARALHDSLAHLGDTRFERAQAEAIAARPPLAGTPVPAGLFLRADNGEDASRKLAALTRAKAAVFSLTFTSASPIPPDPGHAARVASTVALAGKETDIIRFLAAIETGRPLIRLGPWRITRDPASANGVRLDATIAAAWGRSP